MQTRTTSGRRARVGVLMVLIGLITLPSVPGCHDEVDQPAPPELLTPPAPWSPPNPPARPEAGASILLPVGSDLQSLIDAHPRGSTFLLQTGVHHRQRITPRYGDVILGEPGAVLDGDGDTEYAIYGRTGVDSVTIHGLEIRGYNPQPQWGAVHGVNTRHWLVIANDIHDNTGGVRLGESMQVLGNHIHHNHQTGIMGQGDHALIEGNEIDHNNADLRFDPAEYPETYEAGGMKITYSRGIVIRDNFVHHNGVTGIWLDIDNIDVLIEENHVEDNYNQGIYYEISYRGVIRNNVVQRNGARGGWYHKAGIVISASADVEVTGNLLIDNAMGIVGTQTARGSGGYGPHWLVNLDVHGNVVHQREGVTGAARDQHVGDQIFDRNNRFRGNTYILGPERHYFRWRRRDLTEEQWVAYGHDVTGHFYRDPVGEGR